MRIPLFPLHTVLFPNALLPLQVFEDRYLLMIKRCLEADSRFGIVLIRSGPEVGGAATPHEVGTIAKIARAERLENGRLLVGTLGEQRFRIIELVHTEPYLEAEVELLEDAETQPPARLVEAVRETATLHVRMLMGLTGKWSGEVRYPIDAVALSYAIPAQLASGIPERQSMLEMNSVHARLEAELLLLEHETEILKSRVSEEIRKRLEGNSGQ